MTFEVHLELNDYTTAYNKNLGIHLISDDEKTKDLLTLAENYLERERKRRESEKKWSVVTVWKKMLVLLRSGINVQIVNLNGRILNEIKM